MGWSYFSFIIYPETAAINTRKHKLLTAVTTYGDGYLACNIFQTGLKPLEVARTFSEHEPPK